MASGPIGGGTASDGAGPSAAEPVAGATWAGKCYVVQEPDAFLAWLRANTTGPYGIDCETVGVDPTAESPVGKGKIVCWSLAWVDPSLGLHPERGTPTARSAFLWGSCLTAFAGWLRTIELVAHNGFSFDRHVFANHGIVLGSIVCDTLRASKLLDPESTDHGLKSWMARAFGYGAGDYKDLFSRRKCLGTEDYSGRKSSSLRKVGDEAKVPTVCGGQASRVGAGRELLPLDRIRSEYPHLLPSLYEYAALDSKGTLELFYLLKRRLLSSVWRGLGQANVWGNLWKFYERFWNPAMYVLWEIERRGIRYNKELAVSGRAQAETQRAKAYRDAIAWAGREVNLNSSKQLGDLLYSERFYSIPPVTGTVKAIKANREYKPSTSEASLRYLANENPTDRAGLEAILTERKLTDLIQFLDRLPGFCDDRSRIHTVLKPDTRTGRRSSSTPNLQNIPSDDTYGLRSAFVAAPYCRLIVADYAALEPRVTAHFLLTLFRDSSLADAIAVGDLYGAVVRECWPDEVRGWTLEAIKPTARRKEAKVVMLAKAYGKSLTGMALQLGKPIHETKEIIERIDSAFPGIVKFQRYMGDYAREHGGVHTLLGRFRPLPNARSKNKSLRAAAERQAMNTPVQGSATDIMTAAQLKLAPLVPLVLEIHDELIVESPENVVDVHAKLVKFHMENPLKEGLFKVPLVVELGVGNTWAEAKH